MHRIPTDARLDRQLVPGGPVILWREGVARREGLLIVPSPCPFPECPDRHVDLALYRLEDSVVEVNASPLEVWTVARDDAIRDLDVAFTASIELDDERLEADPDAAPELLAWLERELRGSLMPVFRAQFRCARARTEALTRSFSARSQRAVGRNDPCPCGSGRKYKRCCLGAA